MFAAKYLKKNRIEPLITVPPDTNTGISIVIPCLREPDILHTLESLKNCALPQCSTEVIVLINHSELASEETQKINLQTRQSIDAWSQQNQSEGLRFFAVGPVILRKKWAGAGLARKKGMDEAVRRFNLLKRKNGIIVSLDADTLVEPNYLTEIDSHFSRFPRHVGATLAFEHRKDGLAPRQQEGIELYEKYLRYYKQALEFTGFPFAMFTIGSAFAVVADAYVKRGGMNRRQAGEDFYFLQHLAYLGEIGEISTTTVHPSARLSDRVPFGTGPVLQKWMDGDDRLVNTYDFRSFTHLRTFFQRIPELFMMQHAAYCRFVKTLAPQLSEFLLLDAFWDEIDDLNKNCASTAAFQNRFFQKFNAFKILKYLNYVQNKYYPAASLNQQFRLLQDSISEQAGSER